MGLRFRLSPSSRSRRNATAPSRTGHQRPAQKRSRKCDEQQQRQQQQGKSTAADDHSTHVIDIGRRTCSLRRVKAANGGRYR